MTELLSLLRNREYAKYLSAAILTAVGSGMYFVGISWYLYKSSGSSMAIGWTLIISALPGLILSPWIGVIVDKYNVRNICVITDFVRAGTLTLAGVAMYHGVLDTKAIFLVTFLLALCDNFFQPSVAALIRDIAPKDRLLEANVSSNMCMQIGLLIGASVGGLLVALLGTGSVIGINAVSFALSGYLTMCITYAARARSNPVGLARPSAVREFFSAVRLAAGTRTLTWLVVQQTFVYITLYVCNTLLPAFVGAELGAGAQGFGLIDSAWGVGALCGGIVLTYAKGRLGAHWFGIACLSVLAGALFILLTSSHVPQAAAAYFMLGCFAVVLRVSSDTAIVAEVAPEIFGKIKAAISMFISYISLAVYAGVGYAGDHISVRWIYGALCGAMLLSVLIALLRRFTIAARAQLVP